MRYLIHESQRALLSARREYLYDVFGLYFLPGSPEGGYIPLIPVGKCDVDALFITGHLDQVCMFLWQKLKRVPERKIIITSCYGECFRPFVSSSKAIYVPRALNKDCELFDGHLFGFDFPISDVELEFYNASGNVMERIHQVYTRLSRKEIK